MSLMVTFIIGLIVGVVVGVYVAQLFKGSKELNVEDSLAFLKSKGYWVRLNVGPDKGGKQ